jgi:hypothetical protein
VPPELIDPFTRVKQAGGGPVPRPVSAVALRRAHAVCTAASMAPKSAPKSPKLHVVKDSRPKTKARPASTQTSALEYAAQVLTA